MSLNPTFSPDGKLLASDCILNGGGVKIYTQPAEGGTQGITLVASPVSAEGLTWTSEGTSLLYSGNGSLWEVPASGGTPKKLSFAHDAMGPAVSAADTSSPTCSATVSIPKSGAWTGYRQGQLATPRSWFRPVGVKLNPAYLPPTASGMHFAFSMYSSFRSAVLVAPNCVLMARIRLRSFAASNLT